jgi:hypothetical protein
VGGFNETTMNFRCSGGAEVPRPGSELEEVNGAFRRIAEVARARLRGESTDPKQMAQDRDTIEKWGRAEGVDLSVEAERVKQKLMDVGSREE